MVDVIRMMTSAKKSMPREEREAVAIAKDFLAAVRKADIRVVVFGLDFTLWDGRCDCLKLPLQDWSSNGSDEIVDSCGHTLRAYPEVPLLLEVCRQLSLKCGVASHCCCKPKGTTALELFRFLPFFDGRLLQIHAKALAERKSFHLKHIRRISGAKYRQILFFDDECENLEDVMKLGVNIQLITSRPIGITLNSLKTGLVTAMERRESTGFFNLLKNHGRRKSKSKQKAEGDELVKLSSVQSQSLGELHA